VLLLWTFGRKRLATAGVLWWPYMTVSVWCTAAVLWPVAPVTCAVLLGLLAGVPVICKTVVVYDMNAGAFPLDTFFGLVPVIVFPPVLFVVNGVLVAVL
jgi:hypothetical protein